MALASKPAEVKLREEKILERLRESTAPIHAASRFVTVGDLIDVDKDVGFLRGHGTLVVPRGDGSEDLRAAVCGVVERVNKLVSVRPLRSRYVAEIGDVVVGRVTEVTNKRWKVDVHAQQDAVLALSAVNIPGGVQRRRTAVDELSMRDLFAEGDLISAEVQSSHQDGSATLHTRSLKYGKLEGGQLVRVPPYLIRRLKHHFCTLEPPGVGVILGCNGYVWVGQPYSAPASDPTSSSTFASPPSLPRSAGSNAALDQQGNASTPSFENLTTGVIEDDDGASRFFQAESLKGLPTWDEGEGERGQVAAGETAGEVSGAAPLSSLGKGPAVPFSFRESICRVAQSIKARSACGFSITPVTIVDTLLLSTEGGTAMKDMLTQEFLLRLGEREAGMREEKASKGKSSSLR
eukprot:TRINITY_DN39970_c0_g1_i1.p1 TRINITY_DN39970_c0_g1~~TRINITY_DN39970_c0_g1_i1.p1  ORF type:complete len:406 (-),score=83.55 TRINITY_DN39970_c0_g1_i1:247-1464(-)